MWDQTLGQLKRLWEAVTTGPGVLPAADRLAIAEGHDGPAALADYVATVRTGAYAVTDEAVAGLKQAGLSEDTVFEATVAAAVGAGFDRLHTVERLLEGSR